MLTYLVSDLVERYQPMALYLFGSRAKGRHREGSDFDLGILCDSPLDQAPLFSVQLDLQARFDCDLDLVDMAAADPVLQMEVLSVRHVLYCRDNEARLLAEARMMKAYQMLHFSIQGVLRRKYGEKQWMSS